MIAFPGRVDHAFAVRQKSGETNWSKGGRTEATRLAGAYRKQPKLMGGLRELDGQGPFLVRREVSTVSLADGDCGRTVHIAHVNAVVSGLVALLFKEDGLSVVADGAEHAEVEPRKITLRFAVGARDDHAATGNALSD